MKKIILSLAVVSAFGMGVAQAATVGAEGVINFTGSINADSCVLHSNGAGSAGGGALNYEMGSVSVNTLGTEANPMASATEGVTALPVSMNLQLECMSGTSVELALTPVVTSGKGVAVTGGATGVQIMLLQDAQALDFSAGTVTLDAPLSNGKAAVNLTAYYTLQADKAVADVTTGNANGTVNYVMSYN